MKLLKKFGSENNGMSGPGARPVLNLSSETVVSSAPLIAGSLAIPGT